MSKSILVFASRCCSSFVVNQGGMTFICQACSSDISDGGNHSALAVVFGNEDFLQEKHEEAQVPDIPMDVPDEVPEGVPEHSLFPEDKTICGVLRKAYQLTESAEAKELIQEGVAFAKRMSAALWRNKMERDKKQNA